MDELPISPAGKCTRMGFKFGDNGPHISRTMMLEDISRCLDVLPIDAKRPDYQTAIVGQNILGKNTEATRKESFRRLRELYGLDSALPLFSLYRQLDVLDRSARPLLSLLMACVRDPLLRATMPVIIGAKEGETMGAEHFNAALTKAFPGHLKEKIRAATARHIASTWEQSGHLNGRATKTRARVNVRPSALVMALILGGVQDIHGAALFGTQWCQILDINAVQARGLASQAHREGLLDLRAIGDVVEVSFPRFAETLSAGGDHGA